MGNSSEKQKGLPQSNQEQQENIQDYAYCYAVKLFLKSGSIDQVKDKVQSFMKSKQLHFSVQKDLIKFIQRIIVSTSTNKLKIVYRNQGQKQIPNLVQDRKDSNKIAVQAKQQQIKKAKQMDELKQKFRDQVIRLINKLAFQTQYRPQINRRKSYDLQEEFTILEQRIENYKQFIVRKIQKQIKYQDDSQVLQYCIDLQNELRTRFGKHTQQILFGESVISVEKEQALQAVKTLLGRFKQGIIKFQHFVSNDLERNSKELANNLRKLQDQNKLLEKQKVQRLHKFQLQSEKLKNQLALQRNKRSLLQKQLEQQKAKTQETKRKITKYKQSKEVQIAKQKQQIDSLKRLISAAEGREKEKQQQNSKLSRTLQQMKQTINQHNSKISKLNQDLKQANEAKKVLKNENHKLESKNAEMTHEINAAKYENHNLQMTIQEISREINAAKQQLITASENIQKLRDDYNNILIELKQSKNQCQRLRAEIHSYIKRIQQLQGQTAVLKQRITQLQDELQSKNTQLLRTFEQKQTFSSQIELLQSRETELSSSISSLSEKESQNSGKLIDLQLQIEQLKKERYQNFFAYPILQNCFEQKEFIISTLEQRYHSKVLFTRPICKYDTNNTTNVHKYIDGVGCILTLGKLTNEKIVAGFSVSPFVSKCSGSDAIIMAVSKRQAFYLKTNQKISISYDDYFIIYGNSDLRFKSNNLGVFSNLGVNNGYFDARGKNASCLFDLGPLRDADLQSYEFYQVVFRVPPHSE